MKRTIIAALLMALSASFAHAHGDAQHAPKPFDAADAEQKPYGIAADPRKATRTIRIKMTDDMRFSPSTISVRQGETVKFMVENKGKLLHEMVIGTPEELAEHAEMMRKFPDMEHDEPHMAHVNAGKTAPLVWRFNRAGEFEFACLLPGHFEAGMKGKIVVKAR